MDSPNPCTSNIPILAPRDALAVATPPWPIVPASLLLTEGAALEPPQCPHCPAWPCWDGPCLWSLLLCSQQCLRN